MATLHNSYQTLTQTTGMVPSLLHRY